MGCCRNSSTRTHAQFMVNKETKIEREQENRLVELLSTLKQDATPEADFESRFLADFRERVVRTAACRSARNLFWEHLKMFFSNAGPSRCAWGAAVGCVALFVAFFWMPEQETAPLAVASMKSPVVAAPAVVSVERPFSRLLTSAPADNNYTCITVHREKRTPFTQKHHDYYDKQRFFESESVVVREMPQDSFAPMPVQLFRSEEGDLFVFPVAPIQMEK